MVFGIVGETARIAAADAMMRHKFREIGLEEEYGEVMSVVSSAPMSGSQLIPMPKNRLSAISAAFGDGGIHTQWPKIIAKLFIWPSLWSPLRFEAV